MNREEQIREAVARLDVVRGPKIAATMRLLLEQWPEAPEEFAGAVKVAIAGIKAHQQGERAKWRAGA